jgi:hypothetical protein
MVGGTSRRFVSCNDVNATGAPRPHATIIRGGVS